MSQTSRVRESFDRLGKALDDHAAGRAVDPVPARVADDRRRYASGARSHAGRGAAPTADETRRMARWTDSPRIELDAIREGDWISFGAEGVAGRVLIRVARVERDGQRVTLTGDANGLGLGGEYRPVVMNVNREEARRGGLTVRLLERIESAGGAA